MSLLYKPTLVIGASTNPERYSNKAIKMLLDHHIEVYAYGNRAGEVKGVPICIEQLHLDIHTITMYLGAKNQETVKQYIVSLSPKRVIFNPGAENPGFALELEEKGIEVENACTLVLLSTGMY